MFYCLLYSLRFDAHSHGCFDLALSSIITFWHSPFRDIVSMVCSSRTLESSLIIPNSLMSITAVVHFQISEVIGILNAGRWIAMGHSTCVHKLHLLTSSKPSIFP